MTTNKTCDHTSVGVLVFRDTKLLLIDRKRPPFGLAAPAGHVDSHGEVGALESVRFEQAAKEELQEETGLTATRLTLVGEGRKENVCRRNDGAWHYWRIYEAEAVGELAPSIDETNGAFWCARDQMQHLLDGKTIRMPYGEVALEPIWKEWFDELDILSRFEVAL